MGTTNVEVHAATLVLATSLLIAPMAAQNIAGTVKDQATGTAIAAASVILLDDENRIQRGTLSDADGSFLLEAPAGRAYVLRVGAAGYLTSDIREFILREQQTEQLQVLLVADSSATGPPLEFYKRLERGLGEFITREQIEEGAHTLFTELLRYTPAARVVPLPVSSRMNTAVDELALLPVLKRRSIIEKSRASFETTRSGRSNLSTVRIKAGGDSWQRSVGAKQQADPADDCVPVLWVDGLWWGGIDTASPTGPDGAFVPADIQGIEIYSHPSILPDQFDSGRDALCGVVVVWTKWEN